MVNVNLSDFGRLAAEYGQRLGKLRTAPFAGYQSRIAEALRLALFRALSLGRIPQSVMTEHYTQTGQGYYGSSGEADSSLINFQELIDPGGVAAIKRATGQSGPHKGFFQSSYVTASPISGGIQFDLCTEAEMQPYPYDPRKVRGTSPEQRRQGLQFTLPQKPIMVYLREGWIDPKNPKHMMKERPFGKHVAQAGLKTLGQFNHQLLLSIGFKEAAGARTA